MIERKHTNYTYLNILYLREKHKRHTDEVHLNVRVLSSSTKFNQKTHLSYHRIRLYKINNIIQLIDPLYYEPLLQGYNTPD